MKKITVFLDTSIIISYLRDEEILKGLFSNKILKKVKYIINPIVYQEILLLADSIRKASKKSKKPIFEEIFKFIKVIPLDCDFEKLTRFRNYLIHSNDIFVLETAYSNSDYLLTLDNAFLKLNHLESLEIINPEQFFKILEEKQ